MLYFNLSPIFKARQIEKPYTFLVKNGIAPHTAHRIINNLPQVMRLDHIEILCKALFCEPNDLLGFKANKDEILPQNHPLNNLIPTPDDSNWQEQLKTVPISKLKEISKLLNQTNTDDLIEK